MGYAIVRAILNFFFFIIFGLKVEGRENVPKTGAIIVAPNHKSYWDPLSSAWLLIPASSTTWRKKSFSKIHSSAG